MRWPLRILLFVATLFSNSGRAEPPSTAPSFVVYTYRGGPAAAEFVVTCKSLRQEIQDVYLGVGQCEPWQPPCEIVLHSSRAGYCRAVGGSVASYGSSLIRSDGTRIVRRRIDLLVKSNREFPALTHELTHVILADRFVDGNAPLWADEGIATLADTEAKRLLHRKDCLVALRTGSSIRVANLLHLEKFTSPHQVPAFYGQSLLLVQFLVDKGDPSKLVPFLELAKRKGYDHALRESYDIDGVPHLEKLWQDYAMSGGEDRATGSADATGG